MKINILLPYKEKFDKNLASSVSITVKNNLFYTKFLKNIKIYGQEVENPLYKKNFVGLKYSLLSLKGKNDFLLNEMLKQISEEIEKKQLIEVHNRPYHIDHIASRTNFPITMFFHNDPQTMKGSKSIEQRENILQKCEAIFCVSRYIKKKFLEGVRLKSKKVKVLYNGVQKLKLFPSKKKEVLFVGRLVPEKGPDLYASVVNLIASNYPDWSFGLIGSSRLGDNKTDTFANGVIEKFRKAGAQAKFYGFRDQIFVQKKMKTASIIVIPSLWQEPFGLVAAEAMSYGVSVIASNVGGIPEIVQKNGTLINNINITKLEKEMRKLITNDKFREKIQQKAWRNFNLTSSFSSQMLDNFRQNILDDYY